MFKKNKVNYNRNTHIITPLMFTEDKILPHMYVFGFISFWTLCKTEKTKYKLKCKFTI